MCADDRSCGELRVRVLMLLFNKVVSFWLVLRVSASGRLAKVTLRWTLFSLVVNCSSQTPGDVLGPVVSIVIQSQYLHH
jgi:hypothetical protein